MKLRNSLAAALAAAPRMICDMVAVTLLAVSVAMTTASPVLAQWQTPLGTVPVGRGAGTGFSYSYGVLTGTLNAQIANYTIQTSDAGKTIQAGSGATGQFTVNLPSASGFPEGFAFLLVNGDSGAGKKLSGFPTTMTSPNMLWPKTGVGVKKTNGNWAVPFDPGRWKIPQNTQLEVNVSGNDANDCLSTSTPCQTLAQAVRTNIKDYFDLTNSSSYPTANVTVHLADNASSGTCTSTCYSLAHIAFVPVGGEGRATIVIKGNASTPDNVVVSDAGGAGIGAYGQLNIEIANLQIGQSSCASSPKANAGIEAADGANIRPQGGVIVGCVTGAQLQSGNKGSITADAGTLTFKGGGAYMASAFTMGIINISQATASVTGTLTYTQQTVSATTSSYLQLPSSFGGGGTVTAPKFYAAQNSYIYTGTSCTTSSCAAIPGGTNGSIDGTSSIDGFMQIDVSYLTGLGSGVGTFLATPSNAITNAMIRQGAARSVIGVAGNATANVADIQGTANQALVVNSAGTALAFGQVNLASSAAVTGVLPVANGGFDSTAWSAFTASPACGSATITTTSARSKTNGKTTFIEVDFTITALGTCTNTLTFTLPNTTNSSGGMSGREGGVTGKAAACSFVGTTTSAACGLGDASSYSVNARLTMSGVYENQ